MLMEGGGWTSSNNTSVPPTWNASWRSRPAHAGWRTSYHGRRTRGAISVSATHTRPLSRSGPAPPRAPRAGHRTALVPSGRQCGGALLPRRYEYLHGVLHRTRWPLLKISISESSRSLIFVFYVEWSGRTHSMPYAGVPWRGDYDGDGEHMEHAKGGFHRQHRPRMDYSSAGWV